MADNISGDTLAPGIWYFSRITDTDNAGYVWVTSLLMLLFPVLTLFVRIHVRWDGHQIDDWVLVAATVGSWIILRYNVPMEADGVVVPFHIPTRLPLCRA